jgi:hypothetical protein
MASPLVSGSGDGASSSSVVGGSVGNVGSGAVGAFPFSPASATTFDPSVLSATSYSSNVRVSHESAHACVSNSIHYGGSRKGAKPHQEDSFMYYTR